MDSYSEQVDDQPAGYAAGYAAPAGDGYAEQQAGYGAAAEAPPTHQQQQQQRSADPNEIRTIFCTGVTNDVTQREIYLLFSRYPGYVGCRLQHSGNNRPPVAFVQYETKETCEQAIAGLAGFRFDPEDAVQLRLEMAKSNSRIAHHSAGLKRDRDGGGPGPNKQTRYMGAPPPMQGGYGDVGGYGHGGYGYGAPPAPPPGDYGMGYGAPPGAPGGMSGGGLPPPAPGGYGSGMPPPEAGGYGGGYGAPPPPPPGMGQPPGAPGGYGGGMDPQMMPPQMGYGGGMDGGYVQGPPGGVMGGRGGGRGGGGGGRGFGGGNPPCETLFVANIPTGSSEQEMVELFSRLNGYVKMRFSAPPGKSPNSWVDFSDVESSTEAMERMQGMKLGGADSGIRIEFAKSRMGLRR